MTRISTFSFVLLVSLQTACVDLPERHTAATGAALLSCPITPAPSGWSTTGSMNVARLGGHTATVLPSGKVLVVGGQAGFPAASDLASTEIYDPACGTWSDAGDLVAPRSEHTATLLPSGQVLITGGTFWADELYDPVAGWSVSWDSYGAMPSATATVLTAGPHAGQVLVAGGGSEGSTSSTALYDPATALWDGANDMTTPRRAHTANALANGKILTAGGWSGDSLRSTELYDPVAGTWSATGPMTHARTSAGSVTLPSGKVLVTGGIAGSTGSAPFQPLATAELYDPATGGWVTTTMPSARASHTTNLLSSGHVLVSGGLTRFSYSAVLGTAVAYDPSSGAWSSAGAMSQARFDHVAVTLPSGQVLVIGGQGPQPGALASAELYTP